MDTNTKVSDKDHTKLRKIGSFSGFMCLSFGAIALLFSGYLSALAFFITAIFLLPKTREMIKSKLNIDLTVNKTSFIVFIGFIFQISLILSQISKNTDKNQEKTKVTGSTVNQDSINKLIDSVDNIRDAEKKANNKKIIKDLSPFFTFKKDEFSTEGIEFITPKSAPSYTNVNGVYCYFARNKMLRLSEMRLRIQYTSDDWLFVQKVVFSIDGDVREYNTPEFERDNDSRIWEWSDKELTLIGDKYMLRDIANAKVVKMKLVGKQYENARQLTSSEILNIKRTVDLYNAMGGELTN